MPPKTKKFLSLSLKLIIIGLACWFIYKEIFYDRELANIRQYFLRIFDSPQSMGFLIAAALLMPINWGIEAVKWRFLIKKIESVSFRRSFAAVLSGVTVSTFTPNRIGEFAGRIFYLSRADRIKGALITIIGSISQMLMTIVIGSLCLLLFLFLYPKVVISDYLLYLLAFLILLVDALLVLLFLNSHLLSVALGKIAFLSKYRKYVAVFSYYTSWELFSVLLMSFMRYLVFAFQFFLLLKVFDVHVAGIEAVIAIPVTFLAVTLIPTIAPMEMGVREFFALQFIGAFSAATLGIVSASFTLWLINLAAASIIGAIFVFGLKFFRQN
ncbi:MAG: hypothetical protein COA57_01760 [Flavobacteriales bacterium]|nr:MAG: hypothetical protein COA57_01760 [Flavobacteriales bacterium]